MTMFSIKSKIISNKEITANIYQLIFSAPSIAKKAVPGQFVHIKITSNSYDPLLRRPISIYDVNKDKISVIYKVVGRGTKILSAKQPGDFLDVLGPLGNGFSLQKGKKYILVGGGVGIPPLIYLAKKLKEKKKCVDIYLGIRTKSELIEYKKIKLIADCVHIATDDGSLGYQGFITDLISKKLGNDFDGSDTIVYACGPDPMLKALGDCLKKYKIKDMFVSLENRMGCGTGVCLGCVVNTKNGKQRVCKDGPVFDWNDILWNEKFIEVKEQKRIEKKEIDFSVQIGKLNFKNPVITASGTFGYGTEYKDIVDISKLGGITVKGVSLEPWQGNQNYRLVETASGLINAIGLQNNGVHDFIKNKLPLIKNKGTNIIVNISEKTMEGYAKLAKILTKAGGIHAIEINVSCPNIKEGGMSFGSNPDCVKKIVEMVKQETDLTIITKLTPNTNSVVDLALAAKAGGTDAVSLINTILAMAIDIRKKAPMLGNKMGGLSGPAIKPIAVRMVWEVFEKIKDIPIIGLGGIMRAEDAVEFILAGASLVACGTGNFVDPKMPIDVVDGIKKYMQENNFNNMNDFIGYAHGK